LTAPPAAAIEVRRLTYADLPQVVAIERRAFSSPWSLAMFVLELSKPSGICLAAQVEATPKAAGDEPRAERWRGPGPRQERGSGELAGYLICSRYDTVWHVMNIAVDPTLRRRGIATRLIERLLGRVEANAQLTLEVRRSNAGAIELYERFGFRSAGVRRRYYQDNGEDALVMWRTAATLRGTLDDVPGVS
jgi:[ribosomal protein S18]-alanine N-acetyltransferase